MYVVTAWMLVALVVLSFLFGVTVGIRTTVRKIRLQVLKNYPDESLDNLLEDTEDEETPQKTLDELLEDEEDENQ